VGAALSDAGMAALVGGTKPGMTEHEIGNIIERAYVGVGGTNVIHFLGTTPMAAPDVCVPRQFTSRRKVQAGDFVFCELSAAWWGAMEGVLVSAKKAGSTVTITVVSDAQGNYSFPAAKLEPGQYSLRIRAVGYDLDRPASVDVAAQQPARYDLKLRKTEDLAAQLSNAEWLASFPGTDQQKNAMLGCVGCHTLERVARSTHKPDDFIHVTLPRMQGVAA
jgi:Carboxypeptidase regulatory-like domain